jgi:hypothetical protein
VAIFQCEFAAVLFGNLAAENKTDARAAGFSREEGHEEIGRAGESGAVVFDDDL